MGLLHVYVLPLFIVMWFHCC